MADDEIDIREEFDSLKREKSLTDSMLKEKITKKHSLEIGKFISWRVVGPTLPRMKQQDVDDVDIDVKGGELLKRREFIKRWQQRNGNNATYEAMIKAMLSEGLSEEATQVASLLETAAAAIPPRPNPDGKVEPIGSLGTTLADSPGLAILITCDYEGTNRPLPGTNIDADEMKKTFQFLNYVVHQLQNKAATKANIKDLLANISGYLKTYDKKDTQQKVIAFAFSGHGEGDDNGKMSIVTNDEATLDVEDEIILPLTKHRGDIPKLFFFDACRGGMKLLNKGPGEATPQLATKDADFELTEKGKKTSQGNYRVDYSTIPGHVSYAGQKGSMWMPVMARALRERNDTIQNIAANVRGEVVEKLLAMGEKDTTQLGEGKARLLRALKLVKGQ